MKLTRERKIFGAVLLIALGVLGYDQLGGATTEVAAEASADSLLVAGASGNSAPQSTIHAAKDETSLAERLVTLASATIPASSGNAIGEGRDIFRPAGNWLTESDGQRQIDAARFVQAHKLSTISVNGQSGSVAVVDGKLLHIGATIDGFKLMVIDRQSARFRAADGSEARLNLAPQVAQGQ